MPPKVCSVKKQASAACLSPMPVGPVQTSKKVKVTDAPACTSSVPRHGLPTTNTGMRELCNLYGPLKLVIMVVHFQADQCSPFLSFIFHFLWCFVYLFILLLFFCQCVSLNDNTGKRVPSASPKLEDTQKQMKDALMTKTIDTYRDYLPSLHASWKWVPFSTVCFFVSILGIDRTVNNWMMHTTEIVLILWQLI